MRETFRYRWSWGLVVLVCVLFQFALPIVSDEAYYISWGRELSAVYYDHPPLTGWVSYVLTRLGDGLGLGMQGVVHRLFALALGGVSLWLVAARFADDGGISPVALAVLPGTLVLFNVFVIDTLLLFEIVVFLLAAEAAFGAERGSGWLAVIVAGVAFGLMLVTKYTGALVYLGVVVGALGWKPGRRFLFGRLVVISLIALVPFALHLWWSYQACSITPAFQFGLRDGRAPGYGPLRLLASLVATSGLGFVLAPVAALANRGGRDGPGFFFFSFAGLLAVMLAVAILKRDFGLHWGAPAGILAVLALAEMRAWEKLRLAVAAGYALTALAVVPLGLVLMALHFDLIAGSELVGERKAYQADFAMDLDSGLLARALRPLAKGRVLVAPEYGVRAGFQNAGYRETTVFSRSIFGRNQDLFTDFKALEGRDMLVVPSSLGNLAGLMGDLFDSVESVKVTTARREYIVLIGHGFRYGVYRRKWILPVIADIYDRIRLPYAACYMDRYR